MLIDVSIKNQEYIEDCEVCCNPIKVQAVSNGLELTGFEAKSME